MVLSNHVYIFLLKLFSSFFSVSTLISLYPNTGETNRDANQEITNVAAITQNKDSVYSTVFPGANPTGINPAAVINVPANIDLALDLYAACAACNRLKPCSSLTCIISITIIASSTKSPKDTISAPRDTLCKSIPFICINRKEPHTTTGIQSAKTMPLRSPKEMKLAIITITIASIKDFVNS